MSENTKKENCSGDCSSCSSNCSGAIQKDSVNEYSTVRKVIGIVSGKGGVGKSLTTSTLATAMQSKGYSCAILDADITGPSIPKSFGIHERAKADACGIIPAQTKTGIRLMSVNLLLENEDDPVVWRGPVIAGMIKQFWGEVCWGDIDFMFVDMPPGTGDVPLTVFQSIPLDGIIIVTTPQDLVNMIVKKAYKMAQMMNVPVLGMIENMSYVQCPCCDEKISMFGESRIDEIAKQLGVPVLAKLPIDPNTARLVDKGAVELTDDKYIIDVANYIEKMYT
jgi:Mrp family chromosome partitioning ATPase